MKKPTITQDLNRIQTREATADKTRENALNILNLGNVASMPKTQAETALKRINSNSGAFVEKIELEDLTKFSKSMSELQDEFNRSRVHGGIHPKTVINMSRREDIKRYQREINAALPAKKDKNGVVTFRVNASAQSNVSHHMVQIEFLNFQAALSGGKITNNLADAVLQGAVRFDCDCGRHRFWYRYIASVGSFAYGKAETGFPKIRNPNLKGLACKHVIFVMRMLTQSNAMTGFMKNYITEYRENPLQRKKTLSNKQADKIAAAISKESWRNIRIRRTSNNALPKNIRDVFSGNQNSSIRGSNITPAQLAKAKAKDIDPQSAAREIQQKLQNPDVVSQLSPQVLAQIQQLLRGES